jgi:hypothetical protein
MDQFDVIADSDRAKEFSDWHRSRLGLWNSFCRLYRVSEDSVPLFECDEDNLVQTKEVTRSPHLDLCIGDALVAKTTVCAQPIFSDLFLGNIVA